MAVGDAHEGLGRETNPLPGHEKSIAGSRSSEDVGEREGRFDGNALGEVGQEGVAAPQTALHDAESTGVVVGRRHLRGECGGVFTEQRRVGHGALGAFGRKIGDAAEIVGQRVGREGVERFDDGVFGGIVHQKEKRAAEGGETVDARDGFGVVAEGQPAEHRRRPVGAHRAVGRAASTQPNQPVESS